MSGRGKAPTSATWRSCCGTGPNDPAVQDFNCMILPIVHYGHPILRQKGVRIPALTPEIEALIANMFETMYDASGIGLAAQQIGQALQLTVIDVREVTDRPSQLEIDGREAEVAALMPLVLINPELRPFGDPVAGPEGCLSFPEI